MWVGSLKQRRPKDLWHYFYATQLKNKRTSQWWCCLTDGNHLHLIDGPWSHHSLANYLHAVCWHHTDPDWAGTTTKPKILKIEWSQAESSGYNPWPTLNCIRAREWIWTSGDFCGAYPTVSRQKLCFFWGVTIQFDFHCFLKHCTDIKYFKLFLQRSFCNLLKEAELWRQRLFVFFVFLSPKTFPFSF